MIFSWDSEKTLSIDYRERGVQGEKVFFLITETPFIGVILVSKIGSFFVQLTYFMNGKETHDSKG